MFIVLGNKLSIGATKRLLGFAEYQHRAMQLFVPYDAGDEAVIGEALHLGKQTQTVICCFQSDEDNPKSKVVQVVMADPNYPRCAASLFALMHQYLKVRVYPDAYIGSPDGLISFFRSNEACLMTVHARAKGDLRICVADW